MATNLKSTGERQVAKRLEDIRADHRMRYEWAAARIAGSDRVLDAGCGTGYGAGILAKQAQSVLAIDRDAETIDYAEAAWSAENLEFRIGNLHFLKLPKDETFDRVVAFEVIEHLVDPEPFLRAIWEHMPTGGALYLSSPNEANIPHTVELNPYHIRHYTADELADLATSCGFRVSEIFNQEMDEISPGRDARTLILSCEKTDEYPADGASIADAEKLKAVFSDAEYQMVERAETIRRLQKKIRNLSDVAGLVSREFAAFGKTFAERDAELARLRQSEAFAVDEVARAQRDLAEMASTLSAAEKQKEDLVKTNDLLSERLNEAAIVIDRHAAEMATHVRDVTQFDPNRPTIMGVVRLARRNNLPAMLVKAPLYTLANLRNVIRERIKASR